VFVFFVQISHTCKLTRITLYHQIADGITAVALYLSIQTYNKNVVSYSLKFVFSCYYYVFVFLDRLKYLSSWCILQFRKQKYALESDRYPADCLELLQSPKEMFYIPLKVAML